VEELAEVLAVDFGATGGIPQLNEDLRWEDQEQAVLFACSSLIAVVKDDSSLVVQFSHFSVKEFLTSDRLATSTIDASHYHHILLEPSHTVMAQACLSVLLRLYSHINKVSLKDFPLARYASQHFGDHAEFGNVFSHIRGGIDDLLDSDKPHFAAWLWVHKYYLDEPLKQPEATPLYHVSGFGFRAMVDYLISKRPEDLTVRGHYGTPLHAALCSGQADVALLLLGHCVDVDNRGMDDRTPLHMAVDRGLLEVTRILIERGASVNARDSSNRTPLHPTWLVRSSTFDDTYFDVVRYLLEHGADVDAQANTEHSTPLHLASYFGGFKVAQLLLNRGVNINVLDAQCRTPLHEALTNLSNNVEDYFVDAVRFLLDHGADVEAEDNGHSTPLHVISKYGNVEATRLLLERGAHVDALDKDHSTPLHVASSHGNVEAARLLLEHGADVHALDCNRSTPLHFASESGSVKVARLLLEHGVDIHVRNKKNQTPQHLLLAMGGDGLPDDEIDTIRFFLERGADVDAANNNHSTLLHRASYNGKVKVAQLLLERGANIDSRNKEGRTPLHQVLVGLGDDARARYFDTIQLLLERGADVDALDDAQSTPLHVASEYGSAKATRLLLEHGANVHLQNIKGLTPFQVASTEGHEEIARLLSEHSQIEKNM
jgi:ankyrin repeat protein